FSSMRILLTINSFLPAVRAGSQVYTYNLAKALRSAGHHVHVLYAEQSPNCGKEQREFDRLSCTVVKKPLSEKFENLFFESDPWTDYVFDELTKWFRPDVVHINHLLQLSVNIPRISRAHGIPVVFSLHDQWLKCGRVHLIRSDMSLCDGPSLSKCA